MITSKDTDFHFHIALVCLIGASIYLMWVGIGEYREGRKEADKHHIELRNLAKENRHLSEENKMLSEHLIATEELNKLDFMREFQRDYLFQKAFESSLAEVERLKKENEAQYEEAYNHIANSSGTTVARTVTDLIVRADTFEW